MPATIKQLEDELLGYVKAVPAFGQRGFSIFDLNDLAVKTNQNAYPCVGVGYNGSALLTKDAKTGLVTDQKSNSVRMLTLEFLVILVTQYGFAGETDTKPDVFALLDETRSAVLGRVGVAGRPWSFMGEQPEPQASTDGLVFYSQTWHTTQPCVGTFNQS